tara:strand:- start:122 stop:367 length:246 start_codon:yes stop_codon:yes gene_type:complete
MSEEQQQAPVQISLQDIATVVQLIDIVSRRGGIEGRELAGVGMLRNKLEMFLQQNAPPAEDGDNAAPADVPADAPLAKKVM